MTMLLNATITTPTKRLIVDEALDVGGKLYFVENNNLFSVKKSKGTSFEYEGTTDVFDNSAFVGKKDIVLA